MEQEMQYMDKKMIQNLADSAFSNGLASAIMAWFPVTSIIAIVLSGVSKRYVKEADRLGKALGIEVSGKKTAGSILSNVGRIAGIIMTCIWGVYFFMLFIAIMASM